MIDNKVGKQIALLRKEKKYTGEKLAELLNVSPQSVSKWENGKCLPEASILPLLAEHLDCTIDAILIPKELLVLSAVYSDGVNSIDVTQILNNHIHGNKLNITVNQQFLGCGIESNRLKVLCMKYQVAESTYYTFQIQDNVLLLDSSSNSFDTNKNFEFRIVGAYYGNQRTYTTVLQKMNHYDYYKWSEIHVDHETFPSATSTNEMEYLTLIYANTSGIHAISCEEGGVLCYNDNRTELYLKDHVSKSLPDIIELEWDRGIDCTWAGAIYAALKYMNEDISYEQIMGYSGACYRINFCDGWGWSANDALVAYDYSTPLFRAIGYEQIWADRIEKSERKDERRRIVEDIDNGRPVIAINLRIAPEWGVITGYLENGSHFLCRTYFDSLIYAQHKDEADFRSKVLCMDMIISHRDLDSKNVLWNNGNPIINDWESAGYVNPSQELIEVLMYWSEDTNGGVNKERFLALLNGYNNTKQIGQVDWRLILNSGYLSKLEWLEYSLKRSLCIECADENEQELGTDQVIPTIESLVNYASLIPALEELIISCLRTF